MDFVGLGALAATAVSLILPFLGKAGEAVSGKAGERLFEFLRTRLKKEPAAEDPLRNLEKNPSDPALQQAVADHVRDLVAEDPATLSELERLVEEARSELPQGPTILQTAGDHSNQFGQVFGNVSIGKD
ncbi:MAG TPA: hypothetical protein VN851_10590 [Thermoanaerobaculia bacterium]|nr:hypothetical protein [Thermoanaerobaculia bacterium]